MAVFDMDPSSHTLNQLAKFVIFCTLGFWVLESFAEAAESNWDATEGLDGWELHKGEGFGAVYLFWLKRILVTGNWRYVLKFPMYCPLEAGLGLVVVAVAQTWAKRILEGVAEKEGKDP